MIFGNSSPSAERTIQTADGPTTIKFWPLSLGMIARSSGMMKPIFQAIAAKVDDGVPCCDWVGAEGAGHFVKMVHNGIEYAIMQGIAEVYDALKAINTPEDTIQKFFSEMNVGYLKSFLLDITVDILGTKDPLHNSDFLLEKISGKAGSKGTG